MNKIVKYGWMMGLIGMISCFKRNENINQPRLSILQFVAQTPSLSLLNTAIQRVQLDTAMSSGGPFTFFAPSDSAFLSAGLTLDSINRMDVHHLLQILEYQVVNGRISATDLPGFLKQQFTSLHPLYQPFITKNYYGIFINGIGVTDGDHETGDGIVQITGRVAFPPAGSQLQVLATHPDLTFFTALVNHVSVLNQLMADPNPYSTAVGLSSNPLSTPVFGNTMLVPTDSAFRAYGYADSTALYNDSINVVYLGYSNPPLLSLYLFTGFIFTSDLKGQFPIGASNVIAWRNSGGNGYLVTSLDGMSFTGVGIAPASPVKIIGPDIMATNGVIQKINQVFISHD
jgi:uncharacterized surface protein with fasciclin (FAS1) repeats